jgi:hypothetical protein
MSGAVLEVRRSRPIMVMQAAFTAALLALAVVSVVQLWDVEGPRDRMLAAGFFTLILSLYFLHTLRLCLDRTPVVVVGPAGLHIPSALPDPIPWSTVRGANHPGGFLLGRHRVDIDVDLATRARARVGMRIAGDPIAGRIGSATGLSIITQGLDTRAADIMAAIKRYWPAPESED